MRKLSVNDLWISSWILRRQRRPLPSSLLSPCHSPVWDSCLPSFAYSVVRFQEPQTLGYPEHQAQDFWWRCGHGGGSWDEYPPRDPHLRLGHVFCLSTMFLRGVLGQRGPHQAVGLLPR